MELYENEVIINEPIDLNSQMSVHQANGFNYSLPNYNYGYESNIASNYHHQVVEEFVSLNINCSGKIKTFQFSKNKILYPRDVCNVYTGSVKKYMFSIWLKKCEPTYYYFVPLNLHRELRLENNMSIVLSIKNLITVDFFQCHSESLFTDMKNILYDIDFTYISRSSKRFHSSGFYNTPKKIFVKNYFLHNQTEESLELNETCELYNQCYDQPTVSFIVFRSEREKRCLLNWINKNSINNATIYKLIKFDITFRKLNQQILSIIKYLF